MSSVRLRDLPSTTSFRLALLFLGLFGAAALILFGFLYWRTSSYLTAEVDDRLGRESAKLVVLDPAELRDEMKEQLAHDPQGARPFALFDTAGHQLAGNPVAPPWPMPLDRPFVYEQRQAGETLPFRALAHRLPSGDTVLVGQDIVELREFQELLLRAMGWSGGVVLALGLAGAAVTGVGSLRRIEAINRAIERIVRGNLSERLPSRSAGGGDFDRLVLLVNGMLDDIERLMHEVKGVSDGIAHDLRTPLTRLLAGLERARRRAGSAADYAAAVDEAMVEIKGILSTFSAMLRIAEVEDGARRAGFRPVDLAALAADVAEFYQPLAEEKAIVLSLEAADPRPMVMPGDPSLLFEAVGNLVDNAIKFTPAGGRVSLRLFRRGGSIAISVADTGPGIAAEEREAVLRRFYRAERSRHAPGNGLGLSLTAAVARLHGLQIAIEDAMPGCRVTLWREEDAAGTAARPQPAATAAIG